MNITTGEMISCCKFTSIPMPPKVIKTIHLMAKKQGMKSFKISFKTSIILYNSAWTEGVEYQDHDEKEDSDYDPKDNNENEDDNSYTYQDSHLEDND